MAYSYITDSTATQVASDRISKVVLQVNAALTGTIKVIDGTSGTTANVATITNPAVGNTFYYYNFKTGVRIIASGACDITVSAFPGFPQ
jgi:hypothetical protein